MSFEENPRLIDKPDERERCFSIWFYTSNEEMDCNSCSQLKEWDNKTNKYTGRENTSEITYILRADGSFFSFLGKYVILGIRF